METKSPRTVSSNETLRRIRGLVDDLGPVTICILGLNGAGKTTMAKRMVELMWGSHIETGAIARRISKDSAATGAYAPEAEFREAFRLEVAEAQELGRPLIIEGFPRYMSQLVYGEMILENVHYVQLFTHPMVCIRRLVGRGRTDDQNPEDIAKRLQMTMDDGVPVLNMLQGELIMVQGNNDEAILEVLEKIEEQMAMRRSQ